tara:strand:- start:666 stop:1871 length:1206 start_codon:yes stop_codon:yes gene_type:complete
MKILKIFALFSLFSNLLLFDANAVTHEKFKKQLKNTKDKINKLNKNSSKSKDVNVKNKTTSKTDTTCRQGKNFIFFGKTDKYVSAVGPEKFQVPQKIMFSHFSFLSQRPDKNYFVEYVFKPNGTVTATNMTTCKSMTYNWVFKERSSRIYLSRANRKDIQMTIYFSQSSRYKYKILFHSIGQYSNCYNYMNPQCNQLIAETLLVGFRDLKENKSYAQLKDAYFVKVAELKKKKEQERLAAQKKREAEIKAREDAERVRREKYEEQERKRQEAAKKRAAYLSSPEGILESSYQNYMVIKGFYEARKGYVLQYVNRSQFSTARSQIKAIEKKLVRKHRLDSDKIWNKTSQWYKQKWFSTIELYKSSGTYNQRATGIVKLLIMSLNSTYNKVVKGGPSGMKKDF